jgi:peptide/nickel transport system permease protein
VARLNAEYILSVLRHSILPATAIILVGHWRLVHGYASALVSNIVTEDYVTYAELGGVKRRSASCPSTSCATPWCRRSPASRCRWAQSSTGRSSSNIVFAYPGLGRLLISAVYAGDYSLVLGVTAISVIAVSAAVFLIDILYPSSTPACSWIRAEVRRC